MGLFSNLSGAGGSSTVNGTVLTTIDMANGGANDLNNIDITWQTAWDAYDYIRLVCRGAVTTNSGGSAFALSPDGGSTWSTLAGSSKEAMFFGLTSWGGAGEELDLEYRLELGKAKTLFPVSVSVNTGSAFDFGSGLQGASFDYSGTTLPNAGAEANIRYWQTGSRGLDGYTLRFIHEVGNYTAGTFKVIGYNYP